MRLTRIISNVDVTVDTNVVEIISLLEFYWLENFYFKPLTETECLLHIIKTMECHVWNQFVVKLLCVNFAIGPTP